MAAGTWHTTSDPSSVRVLRAQIREYATQGGMKPERVHDLALAVSEIVSNAVLHAYRDGGCGTIEIDANYEGDDLVIRVTDDGVGLSPRHDSPGAGMGLMIAGSLADRLQIECPPGGGTEVCLTFDSPPH